MVIVISLLSTSQGRNFNSFIDRVITKHVLFNFAYFRPDLDSKCTCYFIVYGQLHL